MLFGRLTFITPSKAPGICQSLDRMAGAALETAAILLIFTLAILILLAFAVRVPLIITKRPALRTSLTWQSPRGFAL
jgi:hypothetical protein